MNTSSSRFTVTAFTVAFLLTIMLYGCGEDKKQQKALPAPVVGVVAVQTQKIGKFGEFVARTEAHETVNVQARIEGPLVKRAFTEGDIVKKGDTLFRIDPVRFQADVNKAQAELRKAQAEYTHAAKDWKRGEKLIAEDVISRSDIDTLRSKRDQASASVGAAKASLNTAKLNMSYATITAPIAGRIGKANYSVGNIVNPSSGALATIYNIDPMYVNFTLNEKILIDAMQQAQNERDVFIFHLVLPNGANYPHTGKINFADAKIDDATGTLKLRALFPNPDRLLLPGMFVTLKADSQNKKEKSVIPQAAVQQDMQGPFVLVATKEGKVETHRIELGRRIGPMWVVESGLQKGQQVIVEGLQKIRPDSTVKTHLKVVDPKTGSLRSAE